MFPIQLAVFILSLEKELDLRAQSLTSATCYCFQVWELCNEGAYFYLQVLFLHFFHLSEQKGTKKNYFKMADKINK